MQLVAILGAGVGGLSLLQALKDNSRVDIIGICDIDPNAPGLAEAARCGIPTYTSCRQMLEGRERVDVIINVTNDPHVDVDLENLKNEETEVIHGKAAMFIWALSDARLKMQLDAEQRIVELKELYELGLKLSSSTELQEVYSTIIDYATTLTSTPAGSIAILDEKSGEMTLAAAKGFSDNFFSLRRWKLRQGGLTSYILNQDEPVVLVDLGDFKEQVNPVLADEGVKSIIAAPLTVRGKIIGILYVDDFIQRDFKKNDASILGLMSGYAALAIERMKLLDDTRRMAITDGLTGLYNQQEFIKRLEEETSRSGRYGRALSVIELDIDFFKTYNDKFGHLAGNDLLKLLARAISDNSRLTDLCARTGGEEFAVIMAETGFTKALQLAERLRVVIGKMRFKVAGGQDQPITVSIGVASLPEHGETALQLYHAVDQALYRAKELGRNRVIGYPDVPAPKTLIESR